MKRVRIDLDYATADEYWRYDPDTGKIFWKKVRNGRRRVGDEAGCLDKEGYIVIGLFGSLWMAHRLAWLLTHGVWPEPFIDHINGNTSDNRLVNLRLATIVENGQNRRINANNKTGVKNVCFQKSTGKYVVQLSVNQRQRYFGCYETLDEAALVAREVREKFYGDFAKHG